MHAHSHVRFATRVIGCVFSSCRRHTVTELKSQICHSTKKRETKERREEMRREEKTKTKDCCLPLSRCLQVSRTVRRHAVGFRAKGLFNLPSSFADDFLILWFTPPASRWSHMSMICILGVPPGAVSTSTFASSVAGC